MPSRDTLATVLQLPTAEPVYLTTIPTTGDLSLDVDRVKMRRHILAALLRHGADGIRGDCYCGLRPRRMWRHLGSAIAIESHLALDYVTTIIDIHRNAVGLAELLCDCGDTYSSDYLRREEHLADALAANLSAEEARRCLAAIRSAGRN